MSDYTAIEHNAETGETIERTMTQNEIDAMMETFAGFNESTIVELESDSDLPILAGELNPLPTDTTQ
jgi:uncharacterized ParB-like nuclease family protein